MRAARALALCAALGLGVVGAGAAAAQGDAPDQGNTVRHKAPEQAEKAQPGARSVDGAVAGDGAKAAGGQRWGDGRAAQDPRKAPARGEPYNWRQMAFGALIMVVMLAFVVWLVRRTKRVR